MTKKKQGRICKWLMINEEGVRGEEAEKGQVWKEREGRIERKRVSDMNKNKRHYETQQRVDDLQQAEDVTTRGMAGKRQRKMRNGKMRHVKKG